ncbi:cytochrome P450, partial [Dendrothele bispora CBS 962.96]
WSAQKHSSILILHTSRYHYPNINVYRNDNHRIFGKSVVTVEGKAHQRQRKVLNHAFSISELKTFLPLFQRSTTRVSVRYPPPCVLDSSLIDVLGWLFKFALDVIGQAAFEYNFGALDEDDNVLTQILRHMKCPSSGPKKTKDLIIGSQQNNLPEEAESKIQNIDEGHKDILSVLGEYSDLILQLSSTADWASVKLVRSNFLEDPSKRLDDKEVLHQMGTIILGGHETIAITSSWLLYELYRHPKHQERVLKEIEEVKKHKADGESFTWSDCDSMVFSNACIKQALCLYPVIIMFRYADRDDIIPLSDQIISASGERLTDIPVRKWQRIRVNVSNYYRLQSVWEPVADTWNPERFINGSLKKETTVGIFANLSTFSGGVRVCIGWRFALMETQTILTELVSAFEFSIDSKLDIFITAQGATAPIVRGKEEEGIQMPLEVRPR